jgi:diadenosine tetraphosphate (Ap4A) HIT family hydrolase
MYTESMSEVYGNCPFCSPTERVLKENASAQVILSNPRKVPGHFLVIPKRHVEKPWELTPEELQDIFALIFAVEQKILGKLGDGVDIRQNYRPFMKQSQLKVDHMHFHVIPRALEDYIYSISEKYETELFAELDDVERDEVAKLLED